MYHGSSGSTSAFEPLTRSRTNLFLSYRDTSASSLGSARGGFTPYLGQQGEDENEALLLNDLERGQARATDGLPPAWVDAAERVDAIVDGAKLKLARLDKLHAKHVLPGFKDRSAEEREIDSLANDITRDFREAQQQIRKIADMASALLNTTSKSGNRRTEMLMAANVQIALATKVQDVSTEFRKKQTAYLRRLRGHDGQDSLKRDPLASLFEDEQYSSQAVSDQQQQQQTTMGGRADTRSNEIAGLATSIVELADLFKDLNSLVIDQGTLLDRVDYNIESMRTEVTKAGEELTRASHYQRRSGKCQLIFLLVLLICGALLVLAYRPSSRSIDPPSNPS